MYVNSVGQQVTHSVYLGSQGSSASINIDGTVQSLTVRLEDAFDGDPSPNVLSISLSTVESCVAEAPLSNLEIGEAKLTAFPNPTSQRIYLSLPLSDDAHHLEILDINGRLMHSDKVMGGVLEVGVSNWPAGIYLVRLNNRSLDPIRFVKVD